MRIIYESIVRLCEERGITIRRLEKQAGLGNGTIGKWRTVSPRVDCLERAADQLGVSLAELVSDSTAAGVMFHKGSFCVRAAEKDLFGGTIAGTADLVRLLEQVGAKAAVDIVITVEESGDGAEYQ